MQEIAGVRQAAEETRSCGEFDGGCVKSLLAGSDGAVQAGDIRQCLNLSRTVGGTLEGLRRRWFLVHHSHPHKLPALHASRLAEAREGFEDLLHAVGFGGFEVFRQRGGIGGGGVGGESGADGGGLIGEGFGPGEAGRMKAEG